MKFKEAIAAQTTHVASLAITPNDFHYGAETFLDSLYFYGEANFAVVLESLSRVNGMVCFNNNAGFSKETWAESSIAPSIVASIKAVQS